MGVILVPQYQVRNKKRVMVYADSDEAVRKWEQENSNVRNREHAYTPVRTNPNDNTLFHLRIYRSPTAAFLPVKTERS